MLRGWFNRRERLTQATGAKRLQAIRALSPEQASLSEATLIDIVRRDADAEIRCAALEKITNTAALVPLLEVSDCCAEVARHIAQRASVQSNCAGHDQAQVLAARVELAEDEHVAALLPLLHRVEECAELAVRVGPSVRDQVLAHPLLTSEEGLTVLLKTSRGRDKQSHRHAREHLETIRAARRACADAQQRLEEIDASIVKALGQEPSERQALRVHRQRLQKLADMRAEVASHLATQIDRLLRYRIATDAYAAGPDPLLGHDISVPQAADDPFLPIVEALERLSVAMRQGEALSTAEAHCQALRQTWLTEADRLPPSAQQHQCFERVSRQFQDYKAAWQRFEKMANWQEKLPAALPAELPLSTEHGAALKARQNWCKHWRGPIQKLAWPSEHQPPESALNAAEALQRIELECQQLETQWQQAEQQLQSLLSDADHQLDAGQLENAKRSLRVARQLQQSGVRSQDRQLNAISRRAAEFSDWQQFATDPKRQALLTDIQAMAEAPSEPQIQATRLKQLRQQWQRLGKPANSEEFAQQRQFDAWADQAYEPCRAYYAQQAAIKAEHLAQRERICEQLQTYLQATDWETADMQAAASILRSAQQEWKRFHPCEPRALKPVAARFQELQDTLYGKIKQHRDENAALKREIIAAAKDLLEQPLAEQIDGAKSLQKRWQAIGHTAHGLDQRLWREFRAVCDQIFTQREADQQQRQAAIDAQQGVLEHAVQSFEQALQQGTPSARGLAALTAAVDEAAQGLKVSPQIQTRIRTARADYTAALEQQARQQAEARLRTWQDWDEAVAAVEREAQAAAAMTAPHAVFADRLAQRATPADWRALVLEAEIAADLPSPEQDGQARMSLQVELMNAGRRDLSREDSEALLLRWVGAGPQDEQAAALRERFFRALIQRLY